MAAGVILESSDSRLDMAGGPPEGDEVGGRGGSGRVALSGSCDEAFRLRGFGNGLGTGGLGNDTLSGGGVTGVKGFTADIIAAIWALGLGLKTMNVAVRVLLGFEVAYIGKMVWWYWVYFFPLFVSLYSMSLLSKLILEWILCGIDGREEEAGSGC